MREKPSMDLGGLRLPELVSRSDIEPLIRQKVDLNLGFLRWFEVEGMGG